MLIIGGTGKIGSELVKHFSDREKVIFTYFSNRKLAKSLEIDTGAVGIKLDISHPDNEFFRRIKSENVRNVIFSVGKLSNTRDVKLETIEEAININLTGPIYLSEIFISNGISRLIFITDISGIIPYAKYWLNSITSAGIFMLIKTLAKRFSPDLLVNGIAVNVLDEPFPNYTSKLPMKRLPVIKEIIELANFLIYENSYITGQVFVMDGGRTLI